MERLSLCSYAKVNLTLDVLARRPEDGYHYIRTIMAPIALSDEITLSKAAEIRVTTVPPLDAPPEANLAFRAARLLRERTGYAGGAGISITKRIPVAGGLAGGSSNAAAVLTGLNRLWQTGLSDDHLIDLAIRLGSDVPFFIASRPARVEGLGEKVTPVALRQPLWLVLATPPTAKSTGNVYRLFDELAHVEHLDAEAMQGALSAGNPEAVGARLGNVLERVMLPRHPELGAIKRVMLDSGALGALMSGAGPTVFGIAPCEAAAHLMAARLASLDARVVVTRTVGGDEHGS